MASTQPATPERDAILSCLMAIRARLYLARVTERVVLAVCWGAFAGICFAGARLLREGGIRFDLSAPGLGWVALLLALVPVAVAGWGIRHLTWLQRHVTGITPAPTWTGAAATFACSAIAIALQFARQGAAIPVWCFPAATAALFAAIAAMSVRMIDMRAAAIFVDQQVGLRERVSTALEFLDAPSDSPFEKAFRAPVIASAVAACRQVRTAMASRRAKINYFRLDSRAYAVCGLAALAAAGITLLSPLPARATNAHRPTIVAVNQAKRLEDVFKEMESKLPQDKASQEHLQPLKTALNELQQGTMTPLESSAALSEARKQMEDQRKELEASDKVQDMLRKMDQTKDYAAAADQKKQADVSEAQGDQNAAGMQQNADKSLTAAAQSLADKMKSGQMSEQDKKNLADQLKAAANAAGGDPQLQKNMQSAADAARKGDADQMAQSLKQAGDRMGQESAQNQMSGEAIKQAMSDIDQLQGQSGSQSTMANQGGSQGGNQGGDQNGNGQQGGPNQGDQGNQSASAQGGQNGGQNGQNGAQAAAGGQGQGSQSSSSGSTMMENKGGPSPDQGAVGGTGHYARVYDPRETETAGQKRKVGSQINPLKGPANGSMEVIGPADDTSSDIKDYANVVGSTGRQVMENIDRQEIPAQYKDMVKEFYDNSGKK